MVLAWTTCLRTSWPDMPPLCHYYPGSDIPIVWSSDGARKDCLLGSIYFCLGLHPLMLDIRRQFPTVRISAATDDIHRPTRPCPRSTARMAVAHRERPRLWVPSAPGQVFSPSPQSGSHIPTTASSAVRSRESPSATKTATATRNSWVPSWAAIAMPPSALSDAWRTRPLSCALPFQQSSGVRFRLLWYCCVERARFLPRFTPYATTQDEADLGPGSSPVQQYAAHAYQQHATALDEILCLWDDDEDRPRPASHMEQASLPPSKSDCGTPMIADTAPGACLASLSHTFSLLLRAGQRASTGPPRPRARHDLAPG